MDVSFRQYIVAMPQVSEAFRTYMVFALFVPLREFFLADVYCVVFFSPSRQGRKEILFTHS